MTHIQKHTAKAKRESVLLGVYIIYLLRERERERMRERREEKLSITRAKLLN